MLGIHVSSMFSADYTLYSWHGANEQHPVAIKAPHSLDGVHKWTALIAMFY